MQQHRMTHGLINTPGHSLELSTKDKCYSQTCPIFSSVLQHFYGDGRKPFEVMKG